MAAAYMQTEGQNDHLMTEEELIHVKKLRSMTVLSMLAFTSGVSFFLSFIIKEDLKRLRYGEK